MQRFVLVAAALAALAVPAAAQGVIAPKGAQFEARLDQELNTKRLHEGDTFTLTEHEGFFHKAPDALKGAKVDGHVEQVSPAHMGHGATLNIVFDDIQLADGRKVPAPLALTSLKALEPKKHLLRDTGLIVGGAIVGHKVAAAKHGGLAGAAGGFALATSLKSDIDVKRGTILHLKLTDDLTPGA
ncbi:hypothetical protein WPS_13890 [Vulcanimicrobium alpinum]|uniref:DUF5666 domain-containing protein n=1 Tax=Vulcanimicrobium alpinum TaxID=3016050 RepID=A0AAN1XXE3_UNVUL|nr:hypothetical protein [Vulcanimicrobium alpinum]BDE06113.1 hypothetical protein WPS_13890 [Vulcanimicrobium alpinum]